MMTLGGGGGGGGLMSPLTELSGDITGKLNVLLTESDDESELSSEGLVREEKLEEIMQELYREITSSSSYNNTPLLTTATLTSPSYSSSTSFPSSSPPLFFAFSDVKSESCGASMSDSSSTVMAGIEFMGPAGNLDDGRTGFPATESEVWVMETGMIGFELEKKSHVVHSSSSNNMVMDSYSYSYSYNYSLGEEEEEERVKMEGCDELGSGEVGDDQWLARVMGWGPLETGGVDLMM